MRRQPTILSLPHAEPTREELQRKLEELQRKLTAQEGENFKLQSEVSSLHYNSNAAKKYAKTELEKAKAENAVIRAALEKTQAELAKTKVDNAAIRAENKEIRHLFVEKYDASNHPSHELLFLRLLRLLYVLSYRDLHSYI